MFTSTVPTAVDGDAVTAGDFTIDPPTLINLGFEWFIDGDDNRNATAEVSYRKQGAGSWKGAQPLLRLQGERIFNGPTAGAATARNARAVGWSSKSCRRTCLQQLHDELPRQPA